jgi:COP9 signalosome complex subunit 2
MYKITLEALKSSNNERLWFSTNLKLAKVYIEMGNIQDVESLLQLLKSSCQLKDGSEDPSKSSSLLEVYCLEIQLCVLTQNAPRMRQVYPRTLNLNAAVSDPRIMGVIREEGGKLYMAEGQWMEAYNELFEAFRAYQQAGNSRAKACLKYVVLSSMLALSDINPFNAREAKVYADDIEILAMSELRLSLEANDLRRFEKTIKDKRNRIADDSLLMTYIGSLRNRMREQVGSAPL